MRIIINEIGHYVGLYIIRPNTQQLSELLSLSKRKMHVLEKVWRLIQPLRLINRNVLRLSK